MAKYCSKCMTFVPQGERCPKCGSVKLEKIEKKGEARNTQRSLFCKKKTTNTWWIIGIAVFAVIVTTVLVLLKISAENSKATTKSDAILSTQPKEVLEAETSKDVAYSQGLEYQILDDDTYTVKGIGSFTGSDLNIPPTYENKKVTEIYDYAFTYCDGIKTVKLSENIRAIGYDAFAYCVNLERIDIDAKNKHYTSDDGILFDKNKTTLIKCPPMKSGDYVVPKNTVTIGYASFFGCENMEVIEIHDGVKTINDWAFSDCGSLKYINVSEQNPYYTSDDGVLFDKEKQCLIKYPAGKTEQYVIPPHVVEIGAGAFDHCSNLNEIKIPQTVSKVGKWAFAGCSTTVYIEHEVVNPAVWDEEWKDESNISVIYSKLDFNDD